MAQVLAPHGVRGEVKCRVVTDFPERFQPGVRVFLGDPPRPRLIRAARVAESAAYLALEGVSDRDAAEALRGQEVLVAREDAVELPEGQYFWHQVVGLEVEDTAGRPLGTVVDILPTGANDVYVVRGRDGELLVPAIADVLKEIDVSRGRMVVELLPGMAAEPARAGGLRRRPRARARRS